MQYTGLKDKNGVEIYEGDIVDYWMPSGGKLYRVKTHRRAVQWTCASQHNGWNVTGGRNQMSWEVIGNVYENPDLLQEATR